MQDPAVTGTALAVPFRDSQSDEGDRQSPVSDDSRVARAGVGEPEERLSYLGD